MLNWERKVKELYLQEGTAGARWSWLLRFSAIHTVWCWPNSNSDTEWSTSLSDSLAQSLLRSSTCFSYSKPKQDYCFLSNIAWISCPSLESLPLWRTCCRALKWFFSRDSTFSLLHFFYGETQLFQIFLLQLCQQKTSHGLLWDLPCIFFNTYIHLDGIHSGCILSFLILLLD